ncbi:hypothetical protein Vadar_005804 [Vaccinium darrowii]|uniref:Uncharacterized protein n=1 Tax=Vaccinium darrowii TaxID=229202 RepID=A0ACB7X7U4_9ERIC|nr:hypothetical protein Vadar_005804 [Vaccinium darrowii]
MDFEGKGKDNLNAHRDLEKRGIRKAMHPWKLSSSKFYLPHACFSMHKREKTMMCNLLKKVHQLQLAGPEQVTDEIADLALGPCDTATRFSRNVLLYPHPFTTLEIAMADAVEQGRIPEPPPRWYPLGSIVNSSSQGPVATQMGVMARDSSLLPLHYNERYVPQHYMRRAHTTANDSMERRFLQSLRKKWQGWKYEAKKYGYMPYDNDAARLAHRPHRATKQQWQCLVYYWSTDKKNTSNRNIWTISFS